MIEYEYDFYFIEYKYYFCLIIHDFYLIIHDFYLIKYDFYLIEHLNYVENNLSFKNLINSDIVDLIFKVALNYAYKFSNPKESQKTLLKIFENFLKDHFYFKFNMTYLLFYYFIKIFFFFYF